MPRVQSSWSEHKTIQGPGRLFLVYEDCAGYYDDNSGSFTVQLTADHKLSGTLLGTDCGARACQQKGLPD